MGLPLPPGNLYSRSSRVLDSLSRGSVMRRTILLSLCALLAVGMAHDACAQRRGGGGGGRGPGFARGGRGFGRGRGFSPNRFGSAYLPYDAYDYGDGYSSEPQPAIYVQQPPVVVEPPAPPVFRATGHAVVTEYKWPAEGSAAPHSASPAGVESESQSFGIVLKDGSTVSASTVFASDDGLHYVDSDERHLRVSMSEVDRAATLKLNRERNLNLYLPAGE